MDTLAGISSAAVTKATGKGWDSWVALLDSRGARDLPHKQIAELLRDDGLIESLWWCQQVTVGYEHAIGRRTVGQTADAGFQIGVQRTLPVRAEDAWALLTTGGWRDVWLGVVDTLPLEKGARYETTARVRGEVRSVATGRRLRLTWQPADWESPSTLQLYIEAKGDRTAIRVHHERLASEAARVEMRRHWGAILDELGRSSGA